MKGPFRVDRIVLYCSITTVFLVHWIHNDLSVYPDGFWKSLLNNSWQVICVVGLNLVYFEYALPLITSRRISKAIATPLSVVAHLVVLAFGLYAWRNLGIWLGSYSPFQSFQNSGDALSAAVRLTPGAFLVFAVFKLFFDYTQLKYEGQKTLLEKKQAELLFLKSQINPHFLFNTLNNIYSLSQHQPNLVPASILRLSKILRYLLYETGNEFITVDKEIRILTDYIDLEKLRYNDTVAIDFTYEIDHFSEMIPPLMLLPLVENAFKHGVSKSKGKRFVRVRCSLKNRRLQFFVENSVSVAEKNVAGESEMTKDNIGLSNLKRRLDLIYKDYELKTEQKELSFTATLAINLSSHA